MIKTVFYFGLVCYNPSPTLVSTGSGVTSRSGSGADLLTLEYSAMASALFSWIQITEIYI